MTSNLRPSVPKSCHKNLENSENEDLPGAGNRQNFERQVSALLPNSMFD